MFRKILIRNLAFAILVLSVFFFTTKKFIFKLEEEIAQQKLEKNALKVEQLFNSHLSMIRPPLKETFINIIGRLYTWQDFNKLFFEFSTSFPQIERISLFKKGKKVAEISKPGFPAEKVAPINGETGLSAIYIYNNVPYVDFEINNQKGDVVRGTVELKTLFEKAREYNSSLKGEIVFYSKNPDKVKRKGGFFYYPLLDGKWCFEMPKGAELFIHGRQFKKIFFIFSLFALMGTFLYSVFTEKFFYRNFSALAGIDIYSENGVENILKDYKFLRKEISNLEKKLQIQEVVGILGRNVSVIGHELRNPIAAMRNAQYFLEKQLPQEVNKDNIKKHLRILRNEIRELSSMVEDILTLSRVKAPVYTREDINEIIKEVVHAFKQDNPLIEFKLNLGKVPEVDVDRREIRQVISNLLRNSCEAITPPGEIEIRTKNKKNAVEITIQDTGCGIPEEKIDDIFKPFVSTKSSGMGFGLTTVKRIVEERHRGKIKVESELGKYTRFTVLLPHQQRIGEVSKGDRK